MMLPVLRQKCYKKVVRPESILRNYTVKLHVFGVVFLNNSKQLLYRVRVKKLLSIEYLVEIRLGGGNWEVLWGFFGLSGLNQESWILRFAKSFDSWYEEIVST